MSISDIETYQSEQYASVCNEGAVGLASKMLHKSIERFGFAIGSNRLKVRPDLQRILEVGAGGGQHANYVRHSFDSLEQCDIRPDNIPNTAVDVRITKNFDSMDAQYLKFEDSTYDRLIATCVLAHLDNPEKALNEWKRVVRVGGVISIFVPCEPGIFLRTMQTLTTRRKQKKIGIDAWLLHYREHQNHYPAMLTFIRHVYGEDVHVVRFPFPFLSWNFNLWAVVQIRSLQKSN